MMKFTFTVFVILACFVPTVISTPIFDCQQANYQTRSVVSYEFLRVGVANEQDVPPIRLSYAEATRDLQGEVYLETHPEQWQSTFFEFYANVAGDSVDCRIDGTLITEDVTVVSEVSIYDYNDEYKPNNEDECFPRTNNGVIVAVNFAIANPLYGGEAKIWYPSSANPYEGSFNLCVRVGYRNSINEGNELVSFIDTKVRGDADVSAAFANSITVSLVGGGGLNFETSLTLCTIDVNAFMCGTVGENNGKPYGYSYGLGQSFRICVDIANTDDNFGDYKVTGFNNVVCRNDIETRILITDGGIDGPLTSFVPDVTGSQNFAETFIATDNAAAVESIVTYGFFQENVSTGSFDCSGDVDLKYIGQGEGVLGCTRKLAPSLSSSTMSNNNNRRHNRVLQEGTGDTAAPFATTIKISTTTTSATIGNEDSAAFYVPFRGISFIIATTLFVVAVVEFTLS